MTDLYELYYTDRIGFFRKIISMPPDLLLVELEDTVDFDIAQQIAVEKPNPTEMISNLGSDSHVFYRKQKRVFSAIGDEIGRRLKNIPADEYYRYRYGFIDL